MRFVQRMVPVLFHLINGKMVGVWSSLTTQGVGVVVVDDVEGVMSVMSVVSQVILPENVACALGLVEWEVEDVGAPVLLDTVGAQAMGGGVIVQLAEDLHDGVVSHLPVAV
ncbi:hypothetical protein Taro_039468, partial [Colocasia esculenta]|nr:hypothetical protein [Colocasia esculenta]